MNNILLWLSNSAMSFFPLLLYYSKIYIYCSSVINSPLPLKSILCNNLFVFLKELEGEMERESIFYPLMHSPNGYISQGWGQVRVSCVELLLGLPCRWQGRKHLAIFCCFLRHINKELNFTEAEQPGPVLIWDAGITWWCLISVPNAGLPSQLFLTGTLDLVHV